MNEQALSIKKFNIIHTCRKCKKKIETFWDNSQLVGEFFSDDADFSEILEIVTSDPKGIVCFNCFHGF